MTSASSTGGTAPSDRPTVPVSRGDQPSARNPGPPPCQAARPADRGAHTRRRMAAVHRLPRGQPAAAGPRRGVARAGGAERLQRRARVARRRAAPARRRELAGQPAPGAPRPSGPGPARGQGGRGHRPRARPVGGAGAAAPRVRRRRARRPGRAEPPGRVRLGHRRGRTGQPRRPGRRRAGQPRRRRGREPHRPLHRQPQPRRHAAMPRRSAGRRRSWSAGGGRWSRCSTPASASTTGCRSARSPRTRSSRSPGLPARAGRPRDRGRPRTRCSTRPTSRTTIQPLLGLTDSHFGHGTFVTGLIHQMCPDARVLSLRVLDSDGFSTEGSVLFALDWLRRRVEDAIDPAPATSWSTSCRCRSASTRRPRCPAEVAQVADAIQRLSDLGVLVVAAAGNDATTRPFLPAAFGSDAAAPRATRCWRRSARSTRPASRPRRSATTARGSGAGRRATRWSARCRHGRARRTPGWASSTAAASARACGPRRTPTTCGPGSRCGPAPRSPPRSSPACWPSRWPGIRRPARRSTHERGPHAALMKLTRPETQWIAVGRGVRGSGVLTSGADPPPSRARPSCTGRA